MHGIRRGSTRASPFSLRISARAPCAVAGVHRLKMCTQMPRRRRAYPGVEQASLGVNASYRDGSIFLRTLVGPSAGIDRNSRDLSEVIGIQRDLLGFFAPATPHRSMACSQLPSVFACFEALFGVSGLFVHGWPFGVSWCLWPLWRHRERGLAVLLVRRQVCFCGVGGVVCAALCARHLVTFAALLCRADAGFGAELGAALVAAVELCRCQWCLSYAVTGVFRLVVCGAGVRLFGAPMCASCRCQRSIRGVLAALRPSG